MLILDQRVRSRMESYNDPYSIRTFAIVGLCIVIAIVANVEQIKNKFQEWQLRFKKTPEVI